LHHHEKLAFLKFFLVYFIGTAFLILIAGYFYFEQTKNHYLKIEEFLLIEYARHIDIRNFTVSQTEFSKLLPMN